MSKITNVPLTSGLIAIKGQAAPVGTRPREEPAASPAASSADPLPVEEPTPAAQHARKPLVVAEEPTVTHNFRVGKSFKRAFDQAAFDEEMSGVKFLQHIFAVYQKHHK